MLNKTKFIYEEAKAFLEELIRPYPNIKLQEYLKPDQECQTLENVFQKLVQALAERQRMKNVIYLDNREREIKEILFGFSPQKIIERYKNPDDLLETFKKVFNLSNVNTRRSMWRIFAEGIISGSHFMASFRDKQDFDNFVNLFSQNKYAIAALPMLLSKEIKGFGFALACEFLKESGYSNYVKPDVHLTNIFYELGLSNSKDSYVVYKSIIKMAEDVGEDPYAIDKIFWLIGSGNFYKNKIMTGKNRDKFIKRIQNKINIAKKL